MSSEGNVTLLTTRWGSIVAIATAAGGCNKKKMALKANDGASHIGNARLLVKCATECECKVSDGWANAYDAGLTDVYPC